MNTEVRLGKNQRGMLDAMRRHLVYRHNGRWKFGGSVAQETKLLRGLAKHGFVNIVFEDERGVVEAEVTREGIRHLLDTAHQQPRPDGGRTVSS